MLMTSVEIRDSVMMAMGSLRLNKLRSGLTILGVMIGVSSVIGLASIINGLNGAIVEEIDSAGATTIIDIDRFLPGTNFDELTEEERNRPFLTASDAKAIRDNCPSVDGVSPMNHYWAPGGNIVKYKNRKSANVEYIGTWPSFLRVKNKNIGRGRFIGQLDEDTRAWVTVIGVNIANNLFENEKAIGKEVRINGNRFEVIGVFEHVESNFGESYENNMVAIPLSTYEKIHPWDEALSLAARGASVELMDQAQEEIINALRIQRNVPFNKPNNFALATQEMYKEQISNITDYIYIAMVIITSVGLMVGGIGVMNIMLVSVTERTREIGVRKAIGARRSNILLQFLTEAMTLSGFGGVVGVLFGVIGGVSINALLGYPLSISTFWVVTGFTVAVSVGLVSGMYPAVKASRLDPIEALRYE
ncbi:MAG: ABC transporter permease [candidate division Zixibacteria bacterium]|nr:ABC transporter permease [candidate division Zixibacteria bacterium]